MEEEEKFNTHLIGKATFLYWTYHLFVMRHALTLDGKIEREVELGEKSRRNGGRERERKRESDSETKNKGRERE
jgi:hypothetical protein